MDRDEEGKDDLTAIPSPIVLSEQEFNELDRPNLWEKWKLQTDYIRYLESQVSCLNSLKKRVDEQRESDERMKQQIIESNRKEHFLMMRLATKEQETQDLMNKIHELKQAQIPSEAQLLSTLLDPALNLMFERMKREVTTCREKVEQMQNELAAWTFTPDSHMGKQLMAKCQSLYKENEELGKAIASGRIGKLEGEISLQKNFVEEMKKSQMETDEFLYELDEEVEAMQATIVHLQQQLQESRSELEHSAN